jgi:AcrR family transcriptional regulator
MKVKSGILRATGPAAVGPVRKRREQQSAIDTKRIILCAALLEFAQVGYDAASIRNIAAIMGVQHPFITYHNRTKEKLWKSVAEDAFAKIRWLWDEAMTGQSDMELTIACGQITRPSYGSPLRIPISITSCCARIAPETRACPG